MSQAEGPVRPAVWFRKDDLVVMAQHAMAWVKKHELHSQDEEAAFKRISYKAIKTSDMEERIEFDMYRGPKGFVNLYAGLTSKREGGRYTKADETYVVTRVYYGGSPHEMHKQYIITDNATVEAYAISVIKRMIKEEVQKEAPKGITKGRSKFLDEHIIITRPIYK